MKRLGLCVGLLMTIIGAIVIGAACSGEDPVYGDGDNVPSASGLEILTHSGSWDGNEYYETYNVTGEAKNTGTDNLAYAEIKVKSYDAQGAVLGTSMTNITDLSPGQVWQFDVAVWDSDGLESYEIAIGSTW